MCKDADGKVGLRVKAVNKGVFVCLVARNSPAAMGGLRFGDQILQINGNNVAGFGENKASLTNSIVSRDYSLPQFTKLQVHDIFKRAEVNNIVLAVRDRPFERTVTLHKDSTGHLGFQYREVAPNKDYIGWLTRQDRLNRIFLPRFLTSNIL